jgi:hypothetical protein
MRSHRIVAAALCVLAFALVPAYLASPDPDTGKAPEEIVKGHYSPAHFHFATVAPDDLKEEAGGWQQCSTTLKFRDDRQDDHQEWSCPLVVGMPLRTKLGGVIRPTRRPTSPLLWRRRLRWMSC